MRKRELFSQDDVRGFISASITRASTDLTDEQYGDTIDASSSAVTTWRNRKADMGAYFLVNSMKRHPGFLAELLWALGYKPVALTEAEFDDREFAVALATLQLKHAQALVDGKVDHNELLDMAPELEEVGDGVEHRRATVRRLRAVA